MSKTCLHCDSEITVDNLSGNCPLCHREGCSMCLALEVTEPCPECGEDEDNDDFADLDEADLKGTEFNDDPDDDPDLDEGMDPDEFDDDGYAD